MDNKGSIYHHPSCLLSDTSALLDLETKLKEARKTAGSNALYYAGMFLWLLNKNDKAKEYVDRMLKVSNGAREVKWSRLGCSLNIEMCQAYSILHRM